MTLRVRWVVEDGDRRGGVESVVRSLNSALVDRGVDSCVLSWLPGQTTIPRTGGSWSWLRDKLAASRRRASAAATTAAHLRDAISSDPGLVVILDPGSISVARHLAGAPRWGIHVHWSPDVILSPWRHVGGEAVPRPLGPLVTARMWSVGRGHRRLLRKAPFLVTLTDSHTRALRELHPRVQQIGNPVDCEPLVRRHGTVENGVVKVGFVGRLSWEKGADLLLEAFAGGSAGCGDMRVLVAGAGPAEAELHQRAIELGLRNVEFLGWVHDPRSVFDQIDVLVLPSRAEAVPLVLVEALAAGCHVVATDAGGGVRDVLLDGALGAIVPTENPRALAAAIERAGRDVLEGKHPAPDLVAGLVQKHSLSPVVDTWVDFLGRQAEDSAGVPR